MRALIQSQRGYMLLEVLLALFLAGVVLSNFALSLRAVHLSRARGAFQEDLTARLRGARALLPLLSEQSGATLAMPNSFSPLEVQCGSTAQCEFRYGAKAPDRDARFKLRMIGQ